MAGGLKRNAGSTIVGAMGGIAAGLLLDVAIAASFGAGAATDALFVAMRIPIGLATIIMAGANQSLVPTFTRWQNDKSPAAFSRAVSGVFVAVLLVTGVVAVVGVLAAQPLMALSAPGLSHEGTRRAASLARAMFWLVPLVAAAEVLRAYMNARRRFGVPAAMNVVMSGLAAVLVITLADGRIEVAAWAYVAGALAQLLFMVVMSSLAGLVLRPVLALRDRELRDLGRVSVRPLTAAGLNPLARIAEQIVISFLPPGSITIVNYANRLVSAIGGTVLFRSVMVVLLPRLTEAWQREDEDRVRGLVREGLSFMLLLSLPLTALMAVLGTPGALVVFHRGQFDRHDAVLLGITLAVYASSLPGQAVQRALLAPFYAKLSMKVPLRNSVYGVVANLALLPALVFGLRSNELGALIGVAIAFSLSQYVNVWHAWWHLRRLAGPVTDRRTRRESGFVLGDALAAAAVLSLGFWLLSLGDPWGRWELLARTCVVAIAGLAVFVAVLLLGPYRASALGRLRRRRRRSPPSPTTAPVDRGADVGGVDR